MKILTHVIAVILTAGLILFFVNRGVGPLNQSLGIKELDLSTATVEKKLNEISDRLLKQISGFCATVAEDRDFAMKLLVEKDYTASEVAEIAGKHIGSMGLSFLEITDENYRIISSGHFPTSSGNKTLLKKEMKDRTLVSMFENTKDKKVPSLQIKIPFSCEGVKLYCIGGIEMDSSFISYLTPNEGVVVFMKHDNEILGYKDIETMSEIEDNNIILNKDETWLASNIPLKWIGEGVEPKIFILMEKPKKLSLLDLF